MDPVSVNDEKVMSIKKQICEMLKSYNPDISIHDFRVVDGETHVNVIFDAVVPMEIKRPEEDIRKDIEELVSGLPGNYNGVVTIDRKYAEWNG